jgi:ABC-type multidrug transport system fused ATPase/permease subunit
MTELELIQLWNKLRNQVIFSQLAPTFLLIVTIALINDGLADAALEVRLATMGILLASGIFGYLAQYSSATEARALIAEIKTLKTKSKVSSQLIKFANWLDVIRYVTPTIFVGIYVFLGIALLF